MQCKEEPKTVKLEPYFLKFVEIYVILSKCHCVDLDVNFAKKEILRQLIIHN